MDKPRLPSSDRLKTKQLAAAGFFTLFWASGFIVAKIGLNYAEPFTFLVLRYGLVVVIMAGIIAGRRLQPWPRLRQIYNAAVVGCFIQGGYFSGIYLSLKFGLSPAVVALVMSLQPVLTSLAAAHLIGEQLALRRWLGLFIGTLGVVLVILGQGKAQSFSGAGLAWAIAALLAITSGTIWEKRRGGGLHLLWANLIQCSVGLIIVLPLAYGLERMQVDWSSSFTLSLLYLVLCNSIIAIMLLLFLISSGEVSLVSSLFLVVPPTTMLLSYVFLGEAISVLSLVGMGVALVGLKLCLTKPKAQQS